MAGPPKRHADSDGDGHGDANRNINRDAERNGHSNRERIADACTDANRGRTVVEVRVPAFDHERRSMMTATFFPPDRSAWQRLFLNIAAIGMALSLLALPGLTRQPWTRAVGTAAPDFTAQTPDGRIVRLGDFNGKPVLLNFFSTDCEWSRAVVPNINALLHSRPDVVVLSVNTNRASAEQIAAFARETGAQFPLLLDPRGAITRAYRPSGTPAWFFINADGVIVAARRGEHRQHNLLYRVNQYLPASEREK